MKRTSGIPKPHTFLSLMLVTVSLMTIGYSAWVISEGTDGISYDSDSDTMSSEVTNSGKEVTLNFEKTVSSSDLSASDTNSYYSPKVEASLSYTENDSYPLEDNLEMFDQSNPYGGGSPTLTETYSGTTFNMENHYVSSLNQTASSWINYQTNYTAVSADTLSSTDSNLISKIENLVYVSAPPDGYTSDYKIYSTDDTSQSGTNFLIVATRLNKVVEDGETAYYKNYRLHVFFYALHEGEKYMTYYAPQSNYIVTKYQTSDCTYDWPTLTVSSESIYNVVTTRSSLKVTDSSTNSVFGSSAITLYLNDTWTGSYPNLYTDIIDTSRTASDFGERGSVIDTACRNWIYDKMSSISTDTNYTCDMETDIISDTDRYEDVGQTVDEDEDGTSDLILDMDTSRYPFIKTYFARLVYQRSATNPRYRYYRVFHFIYPKGSSKLKVVHTNGNIGISTTNNYLNEYPTLYMRSVDETSNGSVFYNSTNDNNHYNATPYIRSTLYYSYRTSTSTSGTVTSSSAVSSAQFREKTYRQLYRMDTTKTQDDFDDTDIYNYFKESLTPDVSGSYTTEVLIDYDEVSNYVTGMDNYPYIKFVLTRRKDTSDAYSTYKLYAVWRRYNSASGQSVYVYNTTTNNAVSSTDDAWPTYTLYELGSGYSTSVASTIADDFYDDELSRVYMTMSYYASTTTETLTSTNTYMTFLTYAGYVETLVYDSDVAANFTGDDLTTYNSVVNSEQEDIDEQEYYNRHASSNYTTYYGVDESRDYNFSYYIDSSGNYYFTLYYHRKDAYYGSSSGSPTAATYQGKFYAYTNPFYGGYQYYNNTAATNLTTSTLDPDVWEYQGYELDQPCQTEYEVVRYIFKSNQTQEIKKYVFTLGGSQAKTYFGATMSGVSMLSEYRLVYMVTVRAKTDYAALHMEELLKGYNFQFSIGITYDNVYGDYL